MKANSTSIAARSKKPDEKRFRPGPRIVEGEGSSGGRQNSTKTKATIAKFQGQTTMLLLCPHGPMQTIMKACMRTAPTTASFRKRRVRSPTPSAASTTGTT
jgi:hypothetical protein